jgi:hypothetical protein
LTSSDRKSLIQRVSGRTNDGQEISTRPCQMAGVWPTHVSTSQSAALPSVAGLDHGLETRWLIHRIGSTRAANSVSHTRTGATADPSETPGPCCANSASVAGSAAVTWVTDR